MSNLVLFTNRSGSTFLSDILAYSDGSVNLGEGPHSIVRPYNWNSESNRETDLYKVFANDNISRNNFNRQTRGFNHIGFTTDQSKRLASLFKSKLQWTTKLNLDKQNFNVELINYCCNNNVKIYMTHRRDVVQQFISTLNARYRLEIANSNLDNFIYTNHHPGHPDYGVMKIQFHWLHMYTNVFIDQLLLWRCVYEMYKQYITIVSYEKNIKPMDFECLGISNDVVQKYLNENQHLVPTPFNSNKFQVTDDQPTNIPSAWDSAIHLIEKHKYLIEV